VNEQNLRVRQLGELTDVRDDCLVGRRILNGNEDPSIHARDLM
jgi:hypothetical protein